jgi:nucleotide-binding universal stress UspA family protein
VVLNVRILVTLDGSDFAEAALGKARPIAEMLGAEVHLLRVCQLPRIGLQYTEFGSAAAWVFPTWHYNDMARQLLSNSQLLETPEETERRILEEAEDYLGERAQAFGDLPTRLAVTLSEDVPAAIISYAQENRIDLIAMATHYTRPDLGEFFRRSVARRIMEARVAPVLLARPWVQREPVSALILNEERTAVTERCLPADWSGTCSKVNEGELVACSGHAMMPMNARGEVAGILTVSDTETVCPLAMFGEMLTSPRGRSK